MLSATIPTKIAASHSMPLMKRSAKFFLPVSKAPPEGRARAAARGPPAVNRALERGLVLLQVGLERIHHLLRVGAGLLHALGPQRFTAADGLAPGIELVGRELVDLVARLRQFLVAAE